MGRYVPNGVKLQTIDGLVRRVGIALLNAKKIRCNFWVAKSGKGSKKVINRSKKYSDASKKIITRSKNNYCGNRR